MPKHIIITGSTDGIGKLCAISLAKEGHTIYIHGRSPEKTDRVVAEIKSLSNNERITGFVADLSSVSQVKNLGKQITDHLETLDVLINNAGVYKSSLDFNAQHIDMRFMVNYLAPFVLTTALMETLQSSTDPRIINLSSAAQASVSMASLKGEQEEAVHSAYAQSKLALTIWSVDLAKHHPDITVIPVNPGSLLNTNMVREGFGYARSSADVGAEILTYLATADGLQKYTGTYYDNDQRQFSRAHPDAYNEQIAQTLLQTTHTLVNQ